MKNPRRSSPSRAPTPSQSSLEALLLLSSRSRQHQRQIPPQDQQQSGRDDTADAARARRLHLAATLEAALEHSDPADMMAPVGVQVDPSSLSLESLPMMSLSPWALPPVPQQGPMTAPASTMYARMNEMSRRQQGHEWQQPEASAASYGRYLQVRRHHQVLHRRAASSPSQVIREMRRRRELIESRINTPPRNAEIINILERALELSSSSSSSGGSEL